MNDIYVTLSGNVTDDPRQYQFRDGSRVTSMRVAVNRRVLDQQTNTWQTKDTTYYTVRCYRGLADNVQQSIRKGHPVVVYGKLRIKQFERDGEQRFWAEVEASSVGHDLKWGIATFEKPIRAYSAGAPSDDERCAMEDATREWELTSSAAPGAAPAAAGAGDGDDDEAFDALLAGRRDGYGPAPSDMGARGAVGARHAGGAWRHGDAARVAAEAEEAGAEDAPETAGASDAIDPAGMADAGNTGNGTRDGDGAWLPPALAA
ncbi:MAG: single-stranded DNA-binding protein [Microbispora sp.]|nr:single-stranded DNA-binding protein [Microbispora sp.]